MATTWYATATSGGSAIAKSTSSVWYSSTGTSVYKVSASAVSGSASAVADPVEGNHCDLYFLAEDDASTYSAGSMSIPWSFEQTQSYTTLTYYMVVGLIDDQGAGGSTQNATSTGMTGTGTFTGTLNVSGGKLQTQRPAFGIAADNSDMMVIIGFNVSAAGTYATFPWDYVGGRRSATATLVGESTASPSAVSLTATVISTTQINLSWTALTGATGYDIERNGVIIVRNHSGTTYSDTGLTADTAYSYRVRARKYESA